MVGEIETLATQIVSSLVDNVDQVRIKSFRGESALMVEVHVAKEDIGKVIGRKGQTADAIRTVLKGAAGKQKLNVVVQIIEPNRAARHA